MNREPPNKSMGFFAIYKEAYKVTTVNKKIFSQIALTTILPLAIFYLSDIQISKFIHTKAYPEKQTSRWIVYAITQFTYLIMMLFFTLWSSSSIMYTVACFYTSKDITYKKVAGLFLKLWRRLIVTFLCGFLKVGINTFSVLYLLIWISEVKGESLGSKTLLIFLICLLILWFIISFLEMVEWCVATVVTVLEKDYGRKAFKKSLRLISGKTMVSCAVFGFLEIAFAGIIFAFCYMVVYGNKLNLVGKVLVGIGCYLLMIIWIHFWFVVHTVVYFVCKSHHNEDISTVATHAAIVPIAEKDVELEPVPV